MKDLIKSYLAVLLLVIALFVMAQCAHAGSRLVWDASPAAEQVTSYNVFAAQGTNAFALIGNTPTTQFDLPQMQPGAYQFTISAINQFGESIRAVPVATYLGSPSQPQNLKFTITISAP